MAQEKIFKNIDKSDVNLYQFEVYKQNNYSSSISFTTSGFELNRAIYPEKSIYPGKCIAISTSLAEDEPKNINNKEQSLYHSHLQNMYYDYNYFYANKHIVNTLYDSSSILSVPQVIMGEGIKRGSFELSASNLPIYLKDDGFGNIIDTALSSKLLPDPIIYVSANNPFQYEDILYVLHKDRTQKIWKSNITKYDGVDGGKSLSFTVGNNIILNNTNNLHIFNTDVDYAISFWMKPNTTQDQDKVILSNKRNITQRYIKDNTTQIGSYGIVDISSSIYPFEISLISSSYIQYNGSDGVNTFSVTSSDFGTVNSWHHILCQKSGSTISLYVDNIEFQTSYNLSLNQYNGALLQLGTNYTGLIDEYRIYDYSLSPTYVSYLSDNNYISGSYRQTNKIGNIFYRTGLVCLNDVRKVYQEVLFNTTSSITASNFNFSFKSTQTLYEREIICKVRQDEFNHTLNPTVRKDNRDDVSILKDFTTSSIFTPYITEIGLYNDDYELLALAKLANPIPKIDNIDLNFLIRFDI